MSDRIWLESIAEPLTEDELSLHAEALNQTLASKKISKDKDLMYLKFRYVHEGANSNNDVFIGEELAERHSTAMFKPLDWEHDSKHIIGCLYDTEFVTKEESDNGRAGVNVYAVVFKYTFPDEAKEIAKRHEEGTLRISMETWFEKAECSVCNQSFTDSKDYCSHLRTRLTKAEHQRILRGITFGGAGIVKHPGDSDAKSLALSKELKDKLSSREEKMKFQAIFDEAYNTFWNIMYGTSNDETGIKERKSRFNELIKDMKDLLDGVNVNKLAKGDKVIMAEFKPEDLLEAMLSRAQEQNKAELEQLKTVMESTKADFEAKLVDLQKKLDDVTAEKTKVEKDFNEYKESINKEKLLASRKATLIEKKIVLPESEDTNSELIAMSDKAFELFVNATKVVEEEKKEEKIEAKEEDKEDKEEQKTDADLKVGDEDNKSNPDPMEVIRQALNKM